MFLLIGAVNKDKKKQKKSLQTIIFITFWDILMFYKILFLPQVKPCAIVTYKHNIYELPDDFSRHLRLTILGN